MEALHDLVARRRERVLAVLLETLITSGPVEIDLDRGEQAMFTKSVDSVQSLCSACINIQPALK